MVQKPLFKGGKAKPAKAPAANKHGRIQKAQKGKLQRKAKTATAQKQDAEKQEITKVINRRIEEETAAAAVHNGMKLSMAVVALILAASATVVSAQNAGNIYRGNGPPVRSTSLAPPALSPYSPPGPSPSSGVRLPLAPTLDTYFKSSTEAIGQCYCTPVLDGQSLCFHNVTNATNGVQTTSANCDPPLNYECALVTESIELYSQYTGPMYNCSTTGGAPEQSPPGAVPVPAGTPVQTISYQGVFEPNLTSLQNTTGGYQYAKTPVLEAGQQIYINPRPFSAGLQIEGIDITMNGKLNGIPLEPPNPAICVGNGFVMEVTNDVLIVFNATDGSVVAGPTDFQHFFGVYGPPLNGLSDPYCLYDASDSKRFFVSMSYFSCRTTACLRRGPVPAFSYLLIAVSKTSDPRDGFLGPYFVATDGINPDTNEAYPGFGDCGYAPPGYTGKGCLGDFPNPGMDEYGFWFGMNMFTINASTLIGANIFGVRKADLLSGEFTNPSVVTYTNWAPYPGFTIVPSMTQATSPHSKAQGGSVFLMSSDSFSYTGQQSNNQGIPSLRTWAITNTSLLGANFPGGASPTLSPPVTLLTQPLQFTETALAYPNSPTGTAVFQPTGPILGAQEERMRQVSLSGGYLYSCFQTPVQIAARTWDGLAYFALKPNFTESGQYTAKIVSQGYVAANGVHLLNGAITAATNGSAVITGSIVGTSMYLSAFYAHIDPVYGPGPIHVPKISTNPLLNEGPGQLPQRRTGDYSTAVLDEQGQAWVVAEWASDKYIDLRQPDSGNPRRANWGTYIMEVNPYTLD